MRQSYLFRVSNTKARQDKHPARFVGTILRETAKAVYIYGHGTTAFGAEGVCCNCGRRLTHPVSVILGIGPECGGHYHLPAAVLTSPSASVEDIAKLTRVLEDVTIDSWFPKSMVREQRETNETIEVPADHKMLQPRDKDAGGGKSGGRPDGRPDHRHVSIEGDKLIISFPYDPDTLGKVKSLHGRRWNAEKKYWTAPITLESVEFLAQWGFEQGAGVSEWWSKNESGGVYSEVMETLTEIPGLQRQLRPYQLEGVTQIDHWNGRAILADEMGLGKTAQALAYLQLNKEARPALAVVPNSLKYKWAREALMWMERAEQNRIFICGGKGDNKHAREASLAGNGTLYMSPVQALKRGSLAIVNYEIMANDQEVLKKNGKPVLDAKQKEQKVDIPNTGWADTFERAKPRVVICDEIHRIKNPKALRTKAVVRVAKPAPHFIGLSGTPIQNRPSEFFTALNLACPQRFPSFWRFSKRYCGMTHNGYGYDHSGATNLAELHEIITQNCMIRRLKKDVLPELPPKQRVVIPLDINNLEEYRRAERDFKGWLKGIDPNRAAKAERAEALVRIGELKRLALQGKINGIIEWIEDYLEEEEKLVVFGIHHRLVDTLMKHFGDSAVRVTGKESDQQRDDAEFAFQNNPAVKLFIGNIEAASEGFTLTKANATVTVELGWKPGEHDQAEDRVHRIGQDADSVFAFYLVGLNTIEEEIAMLIDDKRKILAAVHDGAEVEDEALLTVLLNSYKEAA